jgi:hypothetical protein
MNVCQNVETWNVTKDFVDIFILSSTGYFGLTFLVFFGIIFEIVTIKKSCWMLFKNISLTSISIVWYVFDHCCVPRTTKGTTACQYDIILLVYLGGKRRRRHSRIENSSMSNRL